MMGSSGCGKTTLISCLVGVQSVDSGDVKIFGDPVESLKKDRIGFMPQDTALTKGLMVREFFWFFGKIFGLTESEISEKHRSLSSLLELPEGERIIRNCSGGQQRRISFAVTLLHDPELLILDEPTVGGLFLKILVDFIQISKINLVLFSVDPLLRERLWNHLVELTRTKNSTILLSTHYIEEARQSNYIGLMRNGVLVAEDSPINIMDKLGTTSLEEAFLKLSLKQEECSLVDRNGDIELQRFECEPSTSTKMEEGQKRITKRRSKIMSALLMKNFIEVIRNFM
jgi:ABC-type multidrug transport system ATPase subunit